MNTSKMLFPYYWTFSQIMVASWFIGLFIDVNIDFSFKEANYFYCRCRDLDGGSARCTGANALSLRRNCYKGSTTVLCKNWQSNCE